MTDPDSPAAAPRALQMIFSYEGATVKLESQKEAEMIVPYSDPTNDITGYRGHWFELRDSTSRVIYRRSQRELIQTEVEVMTDDPHLPFRVFPIKQPRGVFRILVPVLEGAQSLHLYSNTKPPDSHTGPAVEIFRMDFIRNDGTGGSGGPAASPGEGNKNAGTGRPAAKKGRK